MPTPISPKYNSYFLIKLEIKTTQKPAIKIYIRSASADHSPVNMPDFVSHCILLCMTKSAIGHAGITIKNHERTDQKNASKFINYFCGKRDIPVMTSDCAIPIILKTVGARAVKSDSRILGVITSPFLIIQHGTAYWVCAVSGLSDVPIRSQLP